MQISSVSNAYGPSPALQPTDLGGQNLPGEGQSGQADYADLVSSPRASLTASATAVMSQSVDGWTDIIDVSQQAAVYQSYMNAQGLYGYQAMLGMSLTG